MNHKNQTVEMFLSKEDQAVFRNQMVLELHREDGVKFGLWQDKVVAAWGSDNVWHFFGHRVK